MSDEPHDPLAVFRVPPTAQQVIEHIYEELEHAIEAQWRGYFAPSF
jgi:hypothetical protein